MWVSEKGPSKNMGSSNFKLMKSNLKHFQNTVAEYRVAILVLKGIDESVTNQA